MKEKQYCLFHEPNQLRWNKKEGHQWRKTRTEKAGIVCEKCEAENCEKRRDGAKCWYIEMHNNINLNNPMHVKGIFEEIIASELMIIQKWRLKDVKGETEEFDREVSKANERVAKILKMYHEITSGQKTISDIEIQKEIQKAKEIARLTVLEHNAQTMEEKRIVAKKIEEMSKQEEAKVAV